MRTLDLTDNLRLSFDARGIRVYDARGVERSPDREYLLLASDGVPDAMEAVVALVRCARKVPEGGWTEVVQVTPMEPHEAYGDDAIEATAEFGDGACEHWRVMYNPLDGDFEWIREPLEAPGQFRFDFTLPVIESAAACVQYSDRMTARDGLKHSESVDTRSLLIHSDSVFGGACLHLSLGGQLDLEVTPAAEVGLSLQDPPLYATGRPAARCWSGRWSSPLSRIVRFNMTLGVPGSVRRFAALRRHTSFSDASLDFGPFYSHTAALALQEMEALEGELDPVEVGLSTPFIALLAPSRAGQLLKDAAERVLGDEESPLTLPLRLWLAGRLAHLGGEEDWLVARYDRLLETGDAILGQRQENKALPLAPSPTLPGVVTKEPIYCALACAGLNALVPLIERFGDAADTERFVAAIRGMRWAAIAPYESEGLWDPSHHCFVRGLAYSGMERASEDAPRLLPGFDLEQNMIPVWLGLYPEPQWVVKLLETVDVSYTHALGRGTIEWPPGAQSPFPLLLEALMRKRFKLRHGERLLQRLIDAGRHASQPFAGMKPEPVAKLSHVAPWFGLVFGYHYGLSYDWQGWRLGDPEPLKHYPFTRVTGLQHKHAVFNVTWQGAGRVQRVLLNGAPNSEPIRLLKQDKGEHEVQVFLA